MAVLEAAKQTIQIRHLLYLISKKAVYNIALITIYKDNQGVIKLTDNSVNYLKIKHIAVCYHTIQEYMINGKIQLEYLPTDQMIANSLTKATNYITQEQLVSGLGLT